MLLGPYTHALTRSACEIVCECSRVRTGHTPPFLFSFSSSSFWSVTLSRAACISAVETDIVTQRILSRLKT